MLMLHLYIPMFFCLLCDTRTLGSSGSLVGNVPLDRRGSEAFQKIWDLLPSPKLTFAPNIGIPKVVFQPSILRGCVSSRENTSIWLLYVVNIFLDTAAYIVHRYVFRKLTLSLVGTWGTSLKMNVKQKRVPLSFSRWFGGNFACLKPPFCFLARWCNRNMETFCWVPKFLGTIF